MEKIKEGWLWTPMILWGGYKYLKPHQVKARLEIYKKKNCADCKKRYKCDYSMFSGCKGKK